MSRTVRERGDAVATYRYLSVLLMETLARWVPTAPELETKALFGRHLWELAQHADHFGHRTAELRLGMHASRRPRPEYDRLLADIGALTASGDRIAAVYDVVVPDLERRYAAYLAATDALLDEPSVRIFERALADLARMRRDREQLVRERPDLAAHDAASVRRFAAAAAAVGDCIDYRPADSAAAPA